MEKVRLLFVTDPHASTTVIKKAMEQAKARGADLLLIGGDLQGKYLLFVFDKGETYEWEDPVNGTPLSAGKDKRQAILDDIARCGGYGVIVPDGFDPDQLSETKLDLMLAEQARVRLKEWVSLIDDFSRGSHIPVLLVPGNDDPWEFDEIIRTSDTIQFLDERLYEYGGYRFVGSSRVPPTPWNTPREVEEGELEWRLGEITALGDEHAPLILMSHIPPYASGLDNAPLLDRNRKQVFLGGVLQTQPVGSHSVRKLLESNDKIVLGLHGHVHESPGSARINEAVCLNPGTEYLTGSFVGDWIELKNGRVRRYERVRA